MRKVLVDTNVLIYAKDTSSVFHQVAFNIFQGGESLFITSKNLTEYYAVTTRGAQPLLTPSEALQDINEFTSNCSLLFPNEASHRQLSSLILKYQPIGLLVHDFEIAAIAIAHGIKQIATLNKKDFSIISEIEVLDL
jgi:predicted nucleic acid-binding protein